MTIRSEAMDQLFHSILNLQTVEECYDYFEDLCTIKEVQDMAQRLEAARLLSEGMSYQKIAEQTEMSTATIGRVSRCLHYGSGGYQVALERLKTAGSKSGR